MKKGFTLIELLAVIVILAIIALIAVPIVLNIIEESKSNSTLRSADSYLDALELSVAQATVKNKNIKNGTYDILSTGNICLEYTDTTCSNELVVEVNGEAPSEGTITINNGNIKKLNIVLDEKFIYKNSKNEMTYVKILDDVCTPDDEQLYTTNPYEEGYKYKCKVDLNREPYIFYVLNTRNKAGEIITESSTDKTAVSINLIMEQNINSDGSPSSTAILEAEKDNNGGIYNFVSWINQTHYLESGGNLVDWKNYQNMNIFGPITAMNFLFKATKNWTNTNEIIIDSFEDKNGTVHSMKAYNTYARMPYFNEVGNSKNKIWLIGYLHGEKDEEQGIEGRENPINGIYGYWLLSYDLINSSRALSVIYYGYVNDLHVSNSNRYGVRPVINLKL